MYSSLLVYEVPQSVPTADQFYDDLFDSVFGDVVSWVTLAVFITVLGRIIAASF